MSLITALKNFIQHAGCTDYEGTIETPLEGVRIYQSRQLQPRSPLLYNMGIIIVGQGHKVLYLGDRRIQYDADNYLVLGAPLPLECEAHASHEEPFISLLIDIDMRLLQKLVRQTAAALKPLVHKDHSAKQLINTTQLSQPMQAAAIRLLECLQDPLDTKVLAANIVQELVYRTLLGPSGPIIYGLIHQDGHYRRIVGALNHIHHHYPDNLTVDQLATAAGMSVSVFHKSFKKITYHSPLQYIKKVRLNKAKELMLLNGIKANHVAHQVGYESASQFSREFKRYFNHSPTQVRQRQVFTNQTE